MDRGCGWRYRGWTVDVGWGRDGPWMWVGVVMDRGCGWGYRGWTLDVAGGIEDGPWMWVGV